MSFEINTLMMKEMEEWSVRIFCDQKILSDQIDEISKDAAILEEKIMASSPGKAYLLQRKKTDLVKFEMERICNDFIQLSYNEFRSLSDSCITNNMIPGEKLRKEKVLILYLSLLVRRENVGKLRSTIDAIRKKYYGSGFLIETSGPVPKYNLVDLKMNGSEY
jgi:hypothetical protein